MKAQIKSNVLGDALNLATRLAPNADDVVTLSIKGGKFFLASTADLSRIEVQVNIDVKAKDCEFSVPVSSLRASLKGYDDLAMEWDGNQLAFSCAGYSSTMLTVDEPARDGLDKVESTEVALSVEMVEVLRTLVEAVALKPTKLLSQFIPVSVKLTNKGTFVTCYDNHHMAFTQSRELQGDGVFTLPLDNLQTILAAFSGSAIKLSISSSRVDIRSKTAKASLNLPSMDDGVGIDDVITKAKELAKISGDTMTLNKADAIRFSENACAVIGKERAEVRGVPTKEGVGLMVKTVRGTVKANLPSSTKCKSSFVLDFMYFDELIRKTNGDTLEISVVADSHVASKYEGGTIIVSLNQK